ncbi:unnamed protein product [Dracunculus medinensis]|uniref:Secreted protein n=1 Tax=Dracunculus medinensis TaxID=318479 RepID=A0A0N4UGW6_DRAME|nr:unnamed protein product [Dracunculus medinensis]
MIFSGIPLRSITLQSTVLAIESKAAAKSMNIQQWSSTRSILALSLWITEIISSSVGGSQLQTYGSMSESTMPESTDDTS